MTGVVVFFGKEPTEIVEQVEDAEPLARGGDLVLGGEFLAPAARAMGVDRRVLCDLRVHDVGLRLVAEMDAPVTLHVAEGFDRAPQALDLLAQLVLARADHVLDALAELIEARGEAVHAFLARVVVRGLVLALDLLLEEVLQVDEPDPHAVHLGLTSTSRVRGARSRSADIAAYCAAIECSRSCAPPATGR